MVAITWFKVDRRGGAELNIDKVDLELLGGLDTHQQGRPTAGSHQLIGVVDALEDEGKSALQLLHDSLGEVGEAKLLIALRIINIFTQLGNSFGISLGLENKTLVLQQGLDFLVVGDDAVVNHGELVLGVGAMRMGVAGAGLTMRCPTGMGHTGVRVEGIVGVLDLGFNNFAEGGNFAHLLVDVDFILLITVDRDTCGRQYKAG